MYGLSRRKGQAPCRQGGGYWRKPATTISRSCAQRLVLRMDGAWRAISYDRDHDQPRRGVLRPTGQQSPSQLLLTAGPPSCPLSVNTSLSSTTMSRLETLPLLASALPIRALMKAVHSVHETFLICL
jgi:hypothetical protein